MIDLSAHINININNIIKFAICNMNQIQLSILSNKLHICQQSAIGMMNMNQGYGYNNNGVTADQNMTNIQMNNMALGANNNMATMGGTGLTMGLPMGIGTGGAVSNGQLVLGGNCMTVESYMENLRMNSQAQIFNAQIIITGNQIHEFNTSCLVATIVCGSFIILPLCFMCCGWWKKIVYPAFEVPLSTYKSLQVLLTGGKLKVLALTVTDSTFNAQKASYLFDLVSRYNLKGFRLLNLANQNNYNESQYSDFVQNMKAFKSLNIMFEIRWGSQIVL